MAADIQTLLHSPDFQGMSPADQQATASQVEPDFGGMSQEDFLATVKAAKGQAPAIPTVTAGGVQGANPKPPSAPTLSPSEEMPVSQAEEDSSVGKTMKELGAPAAAGLITAAGGMYGPALLRAPLGGVSTASKIAQGLGTMLNHPVTTGLVKLGEVAGLGAAGYYGFKHWLDSTGGK
jgi:hypothetical protein